MCYLGNEGKIAEGSVQSDYLRGLRRGEVNLFGGRGVEVRGGEGGYGLLFFVTSF